MSTRHDLPETYQHLVERLPLLAYRSALDEKGTPLWVSTQIETMLGYTVEEWLTAPDLLASLVHPDDRDRLRTDVATQNSPGEPLVTEYRVIARDGRVVWLHDTSAVIRDEDGTPLYAEGYALDVTERRLAEEAIRESESRFRTMADSAPVLIWMSDAEGKPSFFNRRWLGHTGLTLEQEQLDGGWIGVHPDDLERAQAVYRTALAERAPYEIEYRLRRADGQFRLILDRAVPRTGPDGSFAGLTGVAVDVTGRRRAEEALGRRDAILAAVSAAAERLLEAPDPESVVTEILGKLGQAAETSSAYVFQNEIAEDARLLHGMRHEWMAPGLRPNIQDESLRMLPYFPGWAEALSRGEVVAGHVRDASPEARAVLEPQGVRSYLVVPIFAGDEWWGFLGFDENRFEREWSTAEVDALRAAAGILGAATGRRRAEAALRESEERLRQLAESLDQVFWLAEADGSHLYVSPAYEKVWGIPWTGRRDYRASMHPDDHARVVAALDRIGEEPCDLEYRILRPDGALRWIHERSFRVLDEEGWTSRIAGVATDITERVEAADERRRLEDKVRHGQKLESLGILAGGIAHDFNNLLMTVLGNASLALSELPPEAPARQRLEDIEVAALRAAELTDQMLAYAGKGRLVVAPLDLGELVAETASLLGTTISQRAHLVYDLAAGLPAVEGDATQLRQVVMNLITNASDALGEGEGVIGLRTGVMHAGRAYLAQTYLDDHLAEGEYVYIEVTDTGSGMDEQTRARIFDPFFTTKFAGRGLGLAGTLGIVRSHGGAIRVDSEPEQGTTIRVILPASRRPAGKQAPARPEPAAHPGRGTVLVVDDEETIRSLAEAALERGGFAVLTAADGREALEVFRANADEVVAVVLDLTMPGMGGREALHELRSLDGDVRVILSSGYTEEDATMRLEGDGVTSFVHKPYRPHELVAKVIEAITA